MKTLIALLSLLVLSGCVTAHSHERVYYYDYERIGRVIAVQPITRTEYVDRHQPHIARCRTYHNQRSSTSDIIVGSLLGAAIGNRIGGGSGRDIATAAGAVIGGSIAADSRHSRAPQTICYDHQYGSSYGRVEYVTGYLVRVNDRGYVHTVRMNHSPRIGSYIRY